MQSAKKMTRNGPKIVTLKYGLNFIASDVMNQVSDLIWGIAKHAFCQK